MVISKKEPRVVAVVATANVTMAAAASSSDVWRVICTMATTKSKRSTYADALSTARNLSMTSHATRDIVGSGADWRARHHANVTRAVSTESRLLSTMMPTDDCGLGVLGYCIACPEYDKVSVVVCALHRQPNAATLMQIDARIMCTSSDDYQRWRPLAVTTYLKALAIDGYEERVQELEQTRHTHKFASWVTSKNDNQHIAYVSIAYAGNHAASGVACVTVCTRARANEIHRQRLLRKCIKAAYRTTLSYTSEASRMDVMQLYARRRQQ